jgi:hypothetical protein
VNYIDPRELANALHRISHGFDAALRLSVAVNPLGWADQPLRDADIDTMIADIKRSNPEWLQENGWFCVAVVSSLRALRAGAP